MPLTPAIRHYLVFIGALALSTSSLAAYTEIRSGFEGRVRTDTNAVNTSLNDGNVIRAGTNAQDVPFAGFMVFDISRLNSTIREASLVFELQHSGSPAKLSLFAVSQDDAPYNLQYGGVAIVTAKNKTLLNTYSTADAGPLGAGNTMVLDSNQLINFLEGERQAGNKLVAFCITSDGGPSDGAIDFFFINDSNDAGQSPMLKILP